MALVFEIVLGVLILASFAIAYMSTRTWPIYQVVLAEFVFLGALAFMYLGARTLATHNAWRKLVREREQQLESVQKQIDELERGGPVDAATGQPNPKGIQQLTVDLERLAMDRGSVLYDVAVDGVKDGAVQLTLKSPDHGLVPNTVLFAFDQSPIAQGGRYQGEFKISSVADNSPAIQIVPNLPLTDAQTKALAAAKGPWTLYETMPIDDAAMLAALDEPTRAALLPKESLAEYAKADRPLRDYAAFFHEDYLQRMLLADGIAKLTSNIDRTTADVKEVDREIAYRQTEQTNLKADLEKMRFEQQAIATYQQTLEKRLAQVRASLKSTYLSARDRAAQLTARQLQAAEEIDQRTKQAAAAQ
ncbi:MAG TPA: hypothetical protein VHV08_10805 [Pirellulales bacterium]|jgi:hypothetical protein|nr:hypothetical protein [Pirellulales bacterium]